MEQLPKDPLMLLSVVNTKLRDYYKSLDEFCEAEGVSKDELIRKLEIVEYKYNSKLNQFI